MNAFVKFLTDLGFTEVKRVRSDAVELFVAETMKVARKKLKARNIRFASITKHSTAHADVQEFFAVENRRVLGRVIITSYSTHSIISLINVGDSKC